MDDKCAICGKVSLDSEPLAIFNEDTGDEFALCLECTAHYCSKKLGIKETIKDE